MSDLRHESDSRPADLQRDKFLELVAHGAPLPEAAHAVCWPLQRVLQLVSEDASFAQQLQIVQESALCDPLKLMHGHARIHWRAAAWLLERTDPENYGRRSPRACSAQQFQESLDALLEAALAAAPEHHRQAIYQNVKAVAEKSFSTLFPQHARTGASGSVHNRRIEPVALSTANASRPPAGAPQAPGVDPSGILSPNTPAATEIHHPPRTPPDPLGEHDFEAVLQRIFGHEHAGAQPLRSAQADYVAKHRRRDTIDGPARSPLPAKPAA